MATLDILINAKNNASSAINDVTDSLGKLNKKTTGIDAAFGNLQKTITVGVVGAMAAMGTAVAGAGVALAGGVRKAADLEQQLANIASVTGRTMDEIQPFKDLITDLSIDPSLKVNTTEAADAIEMLARNGLSMDEILQGATRSTVLLANATGADFGMAADIATDVMALFNISAADMSQAVNGITSVVTNSKFSIDDYAYALAQGGGVAASVGVDFSDFNTAIAAISPSFASGSDAGTSFKVMLQRLVPASDDAVGEMKKLGLFTGLTEKQYEKTQDKISKFREELAGLSPESRNFEKRSQELTGKISVLEQSLVKGQNAFFTAEGEMRSMAEISGVLQRALFGLSEEQKNNAVSTIFGTDAMRAAFGLAEIGEENFRQLAQSMSLTDAAQASATRMDTFAGSMEILSGIIESVQIQVGSLFLPILNRLALVLIDLSDLYGPKVVAWFEMFASQLDVVFNYVEALAVEGNLLNDSLGALPNIISASIRRFVNFQYAVTNVTRPIAEIIERFVTWQDVLTAVGFVIASIVIPAFGSFILAVSPVLLLFGALVAAASTLRRAWDENFGGIRDFIGRAVESIKTSFGGVIDGSVSIEDAIKNAFGAIVAYVTENLPAWRTKLEEWGSALLAWISNNIEPAKTKLGEWYTAISGWVALNLPSWIEALNAWGDALWGFIEPNIEPAKTKLSEWYNALVLWLDENLPDWTKATLTWATGLVDWIGEAIPKAIVNLGDFLLALIGYGDTDITPGLEGQGGNFASALIDWVQTDLIPQITPEFNSFKESLNKAIGEIVEAITETAAKLGPALYEWLTKDALPKIVENMGALKDAVIENLRLMDEDGNIYAGALANHLERISDAIDTLGEWLTSLRTWWQELNPDTQQGIVEFGLLAGTLRVLWPIVRTLSNWLGITGLFGAIGSVISALVGSSGLTAALAALLSPIGILAAAVAALALAFILDFDGMLAHVVAFGHSIVNTFATMWELVGVVMTESTHLIQTAWDDFTGWLSTGWSTLTTNLSEWWDDTHEGIGTTLSTKAEEIETAWDNFTGWISDGWETLTTNLSTWWNDTHESIGTTLSTKAGEIETAWTTFTTNISTGWSTLTTNLGTWWSTTITGFGTLISTSSLVTDGAKFISTLWEKWKDSDITTAISNSATSIKNRLVGAFDWMKDNAQALQDAGANFIQTLWANWGSQNIINRISTVASDIRDRIATGLGNLYNIGTAMIEGLVDGLKDHWKTLTLRGQSAYALFQSIMNWISDFFRVESPSKVMADIGKNLMLGMAEGMREDVPAVIAAAQLMANGVMGVANGMSLNPQMALSASAMSAGASGNLIRPSVTNNATYNLSYQTMQSAGSVQQDIELLNLLYGGQL